MLGTAGAIAVAVAAVPAGLRCHWHAPPCRKPASSPWRKPALEPDRSASNQNAPCIMLEHFAFETLPVSTRHSGEKRGFRQNPRHFVTAAAFASAEQFQAAAVRRRRSLTDGVSIASEITLKYHKSYRGWGRGGGDSFPKGSLPHKAFQTSKYHRSSLTPAPPDRAQPDRRRACPCCRSRCRPAWRSSRPR